MISNFKVFALLTVLPTALYGARLGSGGGLSYSAPPANGNGGGGGYPDAQGPLAGGSPGFGAGLNSSPAGGSGGEGEFGPPPPLPETSFACGDYEYPGYYADVEAGCTIFHICQEDGRHDTFWCPQETLFNQQYLVCDWPTNVDCENSEQFFSVNAEIGKVPEGGEFSQGNGGSGGAPAGFGGGANGAPAFGGGGGSQGYASAPSTSYGVPN